MNTHNLGKELFSCTVFVPGFAGRGVYRLNIGICSELLLKFECICFPKHIWPGGFCVNNRGFVLPGHKRLISNPLGQPSQCCQSA